MRQTTEIIAMFLIMVVIVVIAIMPSKEHKVKEDKVADGPTYRVKEQTPIEILEARVKAVEMELQKNSCEKKGGVFVVYSWCKKDGVDYYYKDGEWQNEETKTNILK